ARLVPYQRPEDLKPVRTQFESAATSGKPADLRPYAWAGLVLADGSFDQVWTVAAKSPATLADLLKSIPLLPDPDLRAKAYNQVKPLVEKRDSNLAVRRAAIRALTSMNYEQEAVFTTLSDLIVKGEEVPAAAQGLRIIPRSKWPRAQAGQAATGLVAWAKAIPASERTSQE